MCEPATSVDTPIVTICDMDGLNNLLRVVKETVDTPVVRGELEKLYLYNCKKNNIPEWDPMMTLSAISLEKLLSLRVNVLGSEIYFKYIG